MSTDDAQTFGLQQTIGGCRIGYTSLTRLGTTSVVTVDKIFCFEYTLSSTLT